MDGTKLNDLRIICRTGSEKLCVLYPCTIETTLESRHPILLNPCTPSSKLCTLYPRSRAYKPCTSSSSSTRNLTKKRNNRINPLMINVQKLRLNPWLFSITIIRLVIVFTFSFNAQAETWYSKKKLKFKIKQTYKVVQIYPETLCLLYSKSNLYH